MNLIILQDCDRLEGGLFLIRDYRAEHIRNILKSAQGDTIEAGLINQSTGKAIIQSINENEIELEYRPDKKGIPNVAPEIEIICALPRPQTLKKVLFICGMTSVRKLHLIRANRVEKSYYHSPLLEEKNLRKNLLEGMSQGKSIRLPAVEIHHKFRQFIEDFLPLLEKSEKQTPLKILPEMQAEYFLDKNFQNPKQPVYIAIGPEGGWVPFETEHFMKAGFVQVCLGQAVLRVEHALAYSLAQVELLKNMQTR